MTRCWTLCEDKAGMVSQCRGLAEALDVEAASKLINRRLPWSLLPAALWLDPLRAPGPGSDPLVPPWPDLLIACGRYSVPLSIAIKRASGGATFTVQIQDPRVDPAKFDLVVAPSHDRCRGPNVVVTMGALGPVNAQRLKSAAARFAPTLEHLPRPLVTVLLGGSNAYYRFTERRAAALADQLLSLVRERAVGLAISPSRRTDPGPFRLLRERLAGDAAVIWDGSGENPYFGYLALADFVLVTADSVSMTSEACATGKPVYVIELEGGGRRFRAFHREMQAAGYTRAFRGALERWGYTPLNESARVAAEVRRRLQSLASYA